MIERLDTMGYTDEIKQLLQYLNNGGVILKYQSFQLSAHSAEKGRNWCLSGGSRRNSLNTLLYHRSHSEELNPKHMQYLTYQADVGEAQEALG